MSEEGTAICIIEHTPIRPPLPKGPKMGKKPRPKPSDPKTKLKITINKYKCKAAIGTEAERVLAGILLVILSEPNVPEGVKEVVRGRYEKFCRRKEELVREQSS